MTGAIYRLFEPLRGLVCLLLLLAGTVTEVAAQAAGPELFAEEILNTSQDEYGPVFTQDGQTVFFTVRRSRRGAEHLVTSSRDGTSWSAPETLPFSGAGMDKEPFLSLDGSKLYFASKRHVNGQDLDFEIWMSERTNSGWGEPVHLAAVGSDAYDNYPSVAANGNMYFGSSRVEGRGRLHRAVWSGDGYETPKMITIDGSPVDGADPFIDPEERFMIFSSTRDGGFGEGDLYFTRNVSGAWSDPENLGDIINTDTYEYTPFIPADREFLYFSRGWGEMWRIKLTEVMSALGEEF